MVSEVSGGFKVLLKSAKKFEILIFNLFKGVLLEKWGFWWFLIKMVFQDQGGAFKVKTLSQLRFLRFDCDFLFLMIKVRIF